MSTSCAPINCSMGWKLFSYLEKYPNNYDVAFSVGPEKTVVKALKIILRSSSSVFEREFRDNWEQAVVTEAEGIPLPDLDPAAFKLFIKLMILDTWSVNAIKKLKLKSNQLLHLMAICQKYEMTVAIESLTELVKEFFKNFETYVKTDDFLLLSQPQLESILSSDDLPMDEPDIFNYTCKWGEAQCQKQNLEATTENLRQVLAGCLYKIRFPVMSLAEFTNTVVVGYKSLLTLEEQCDIFTFIGLDKESRSEDNATHLDFECKPRAASWERGCLKLCLSNKFTTNDKPPYVCEGSEKLQYLATKRKIALHGLGFFGPVNEDGFYDVTVRLTNHGGSTDIFPEKMEKRIAAQKGKIFCFRLEKPVLLDAGSVDCWKVYYGIRYSLKGPDTISVKRKGWNQTIGQDGEIRFRFEWHDEQLAEIYYTNL